MNARAFVILILFLAWGFCSAIWLSSRMDEPSIKDLESNPHFFSLRTAQQKVNPSSVIYFSYKGAETCDFPHAEQTLDSIVSEMAERKGKLLITGHTDQKGSRAYNLELGRSRAEYMARRLADKGVPSHRLIVHSVGEEEAEPDSLEFARKVEFSYLEDF